VTDSTRIICPACGELDKSLVDIYNMNLRKQDFALSPVLPACKQCNLEIEIAEPIDNTGLSVDETVMRIMEIHQNNLIRKGMYG